MRCHAKKIILKKRLGHIKNNLLRLKDMFFFKRQNAWSMSSIDWWLNQNFPVGPSSGDPEFTGDP